MDKKPLVRGARKVLDMFWKFVQDAGQNILSADVRLIPERIATENEYIPAKLRFFFVKLPVYGNTSAVFFTSMDSEYELPGEATKVVTGPFVRQEDTVDGMVRIGYVSPAAGAAPTRIVVDTTPIIRACGLGEEDCLFGPEEESGEDLTLSLTPPAGTGITRLLNAPCAVHGSIGQGNMFTVTGAIGPVTKFRSVEEFIRNASLAGFTMDVSRLLFIMAEEELRRNDAYDSIPASLDPEEVGLAKNAIEVGKEPEDYLEKRSKQLLYRIVTGKRIACHTPVPFLNSADVGVSKSQLVDAIVSADDVNSEGGAYPALIGKTAERLFKEYHDDIMAFSRQYIGEAKALHAAFNGKEARRCNLAYMAKERNKARDMVMDMILYRSIQATKSAEPMYRIGEINAPEDYIGRRPVGRQIMCRNFEEANAMSDILQSVDVREHITPMPVRAVKVNAEDVKPVSLGDFNDCYSSGLFRRAGATDKMYWQPVRPYGNAYLCREEITARAMQYLLGGKEEIFRISGYLDLFRLYWNMTFGDFGEYKADKLPTTESEADMLLSALRESCPKWWFIAKNDYVLLHGWYVVPHDKPDNAN